MSETPIGIASEKNRTGWISFLGQTMAEPVRLAVERLVKIAKEELACTLDVQPFQDGSVPYPILLLPSSRNEPARTLLKEAEIPVSVDGTILPLSQHPYGDQGFAAGRGRGTNGDYLWLAANSPVGLKNAVLTLCDRLYRDDRGDIVADNFAGVHCPAFECRHIKTDAMNCGRFRSRLEYWDPAGAAGVNDFADWLASFRLTDYNFISFMRGWGATYPSGRFPALVDTQHPNPPQDYYPRIIDRLHGWGIKTWAADMYVGSGYSMEVGMCPQMLSPCADKKRLRPFRAGEGSFAEILSDPQTIACLSHPDAARYYCDIVLDIMEQYPRLDGLDFHIGHMFPDKICRCPKCGGYQGNRQTLYQCFQQIYQTALKQNPDIRMKAAVKMFGDATRVIVEHHQEFPNLEFFSWMRWIENFSSERTDAPVTTGHEDGGGGLEAWYHAPNAALSTIREYDRDYEPWLPTYIRMARQAGLKSMSWEPNLHRELEHLFFFYSQLTWEPDLSWAELARRYVLRSKRRLDEKRIQAYTLAMEINASITSYGFIPRENACCGRVVQSGGLLETPELREKISALADMLHSMGITDGSQASGPAMFDLEWSLSKALSRFQKRNVLESGH